MIQFLIKEIRDKKGATLKYLNFQTKISMSYLSEIENNKVQNPSFDKIVKIAKALGCSVTELYYDTESLFSSQRALDLYVETYGMQDKKTVALSQAINNLVMQACTKKENSHKKEKET